MCYGDPFYGSDGYYLEWLKQQEIEHRKREEARNQEQEEQSQE